MIRYPNVCLILALLALGACAANNGDQPTSPPAGAVADAAASATPDPHALKNPEYGGTETFAIVGAEPLPLDKRYEELSDEQKGVYRSWYQNLGSNDAPPFPENGLLNLYQQTMGIHQIYIHRSGGRYGIVGRYVVVVPVDEHGVAHSIAIRKVGAYGVHGNLEPDDGLAKYLAAIFMREKYRPAQCGGAPCAMDFAVSLNLVPDSG
jgi:hypothetical protein